MPLASPAPTAVRPPAALAALAGLCRLHIVAIAALAAVVVGWVFGGTLRAAPALVVGIDWFLLNLWNRLADVPEDRRNGVPGVEWAARHGRALGRGLGGMFVLSAIIAWPLGWPLLCARLLFHAGGFVYSFHAFGLRRLKELTAVKNLASGALFLLSVFGYPLLARGGPRADGAELAFLMAFFLPFEITYELIYDLRDVEGDRAEGLRTVPVLRGDCWTRRLIAGLLLASAGALVVGFATGSLAFAELVMVAAPVQQWLLLRGPLRARVTGGAAVFATWLGAAQLASFIAWVGAGLPLGPGR